MRSLPLSPESYRVKSGGGGVKESAQPSSVPVAFDGRFPLFFRCFAIALQAGSGWTSVLRASSSRRTTFKIYMYIPYFMSYNHYPS